MAQSQLPLTAQEMIELLQELVQRGEVLIRKSPLLDGRMNVIWNAHSEKRAGSIADSMGAAILAVAAELKQREEAEQSSQ